MEKITHTGLRDLIFNEVKKVIFVSIYAVTKQTSLNKGRGSNAMVEAIKIDPDKIEKHTDLTFDISGTDKISYANFVNGRLGKEDKEKDFEANAPKWAKRVKDDCPAVCTNAKTGKGLYLGAICVSNNKPKVRHIYKGNPINLTEARFDPYQKHEKNEGKSQGTDNPIIYRLYDFKNIKEIAILGKRYEVIPDPE